MEHIRTWISGDYRLELSDTFCVDSCGQSHLAYQFFYEGKLVFEGEDFSGSPLHADDSDETVAALLSFLACQPGDVDSEYFRDYTPEQRAFAESYAAEYLGYLAMEMEEEARARG